MKQEECSILAHLFFNVFLIKIVSLAVQIGVGAMMNTVVALSVVRRAALRANNNIVAVLKLLFAYRANAVIVY